MRRRWAIAVLFLAACVVKPAAAQGKENCSAYASGIVFGNYSGLTVDVTGTITVNCSGNTLFHIGLNAGNTPGATITNREMFGGNGGQNRLGYQLFSDAARTINWGNSRGTDWVTGIGQGNGHPLNFVIYGRIPAGQNTPSGNYTDTITASITGSFNTATAQFSVTAMDVPSCTVTASNLSFGAYTGALDNSTSTIAVLCPAGTPYNLGLDAGRSAGATVTNRHMTGPGGSLLGYKLFQDASRTLNWGNTVGVDTVFSTSGGFRLWPVYGQVPAGQSIRAGAYTDTITATVYF